MIFVESNTTGSGMMAIAAARRLGLHPLLLTSDSSRYPELGSTGAEIARCDTNDGDALDRAVGGAGGELAGVTTTSDFYLTAVAELAARQGLPGNPPDAVRRCRDKSATRRALAAAAVPQPAFAVVDGADPGVGPPRDVALPCVVKPVDESGSEDVLLCRSEAEVRAHLLFLLAKRTNARGQPAVTVALVEEYVAGPEYSVEMFHTAGRARCVGITAKVVGGTPFFVEHGHFHPAALEPEVARRLVTVAGAALDAVGVRDGPTHTELKVTPAGPVVVEINARLAGGMIPELIRLTAGIDLPEQQVRAAAGLAVHLTPTLTSHPSAGIRFLVAPRPGRLRGVSGAAEARALPGIAGLYVRAPSDKLVGPARSALDRLGYVIAVGGSRADVEARLDRALGTLRLTVEPWV